MSEPTGMLCVVPSRLGLGEEFTVKIKVLGPIREIPCSGNWNTRKPRLAGPFNLNVSRRIQYVDNCLPEWTGRLLLDGGSALEGPSELVFDGHSQGVFSGDTRPIRCVGGLRWTTPGFHFLKITDPASGVEAWANPVYVSERPPRERIYWGDPHWQTFFSDGIRCPEELYAFARDEGFLDFGAISDHMEAVTDRQWDYFQAVTNDYNEPGRFATLHGQEWTNHNPKVGAPGHRNIYYRGDGGPVLRSNDPDCNTLEKLWKTLDGMKGIEALAIPHHSANRVMGVDWGLGWNPEYEKAVEIYSVWGNSERPGEDGNPLPIAEYNLGGEMAGRHVVDALKLGYRFGFVGGGDIHDGRPGDCLHGDSYPPEGSAVQYPQGITAAAAPELTREHIYDAIKARQTYATTKSRIYLETQVHGEGDRRRLVISAASEHGIREVAVVRNGDDAEKRLPETDPRVVTSQANVGDMAPDEFCYVRVLTEKGDMAWSSPLWGD